MGGLASSTIHVEELLLLVVRSCLYLLPTSTTRSLVKKNGLFKSRWRAQKLQEQFVLWYIPLRGYSSQDGGERKSSRNNACCGIPLKVYLRKQR